MTSLRRGGWMVLAFATAAVVGPVHQAMAASPEQAELAERLLETGQQLDRVSPAAAAALGDAAEPMVDNDARLLRMAADLRLSLGQRDSAIKLLSAIRQIDPSDQIAMVQSLDLISSRMETADQKADYLTRIVDNTAVAAEVRSHAALLLAGVQSQRGQDDAAETALDQTLRLNPLNIKALQWRLDERMRSGTAVQRARALVDLLLANPLQTTVLSRLAEEHARAGAADVALDLYHRLFDQYAAGQSPPATDDAINYVVLLLQAGKTKEIAGILDAATKNDPSSPRLQYLIVLVAQQSGDANAVATQIAAARNVLTKNVMAVQASFDKDAPKVDDMTKIALPDLGKAAAQLKSLNQPKATAAYVSALADLAWLDVYFAGQPAPTPVTEAINTLADPSGVVANRINGFDALAGGQLDAANVKLSAVAARDPLSQLGLLSLHLKQGQDKSAIAAEGQKLLEQFPVDVWSLMIRQSLQKAGALTFRAGDADAIVAESNRLPRPWLEFAQTAPQSYLLDVDALTPSITIGQPLLAKVTLQNTGDRPLLIGPGGVIDQHIPIDLTVRSMAEQNFPGAAVARITGRIVLPPNQTVSAMVRLDSPQLDSYIAANPQFGLSIFVSAVVNPVLRGEVVVPGLGGMRSQSRSVIDRQPTTYTQLAVRQKLASAMQSDDAVVRLRTVVQLSAAAAQLLTAGDDQKPLATEATALVQKAADSDASATVRAVARQQLAIQEQDAAAVGKAVQAMLASPDVESRLIGCVMTINRTAAERKAWLAGLSKDSNPSVQKLAAAIALLPEAATQPATTPSN